MIDNNMLNFRQMSVLDIPEAFEVRISTVENVVSIQELEDEYGLTPETLAVAMSGSSQGWVCTEDERIVGLAMGDQETGEMSVVAVRPEYEGRGIGGKLLNLVQDWLFESGHDELWLVTTPDPGFRAYGFYISRGWRPTGDIDDGDEKFVLRRKVCQ
jgi:ribosomal protein S18 acetylase RimI-like enzyme